MTEDDPAKRKEAFLKMLDDEPPFNKEKYDADMIALEGTMWEWAGMDDDGSISVKTWEIRENGRRGDGGYVIRPEEEGYEQCKQLYGLKKPGDSYSVMKKLIDGLWEIVPEEQA